MSRNSQAHTAASTDVVDPHFRGRGIAAILDRIRSDAAERLECRTVLVVWSPHSGERRRQSLLRQGFRSVSNEQPLPDGGFGMSFPYAKRIAPLSPFTGENPLRSFPAQRHNGRHWALQLFGGSSMKRGFQGRPI
jgi:hypothetical protein